MPWGTVGQAKHDPHSTDPRFTSSMFFRGLRPPFKKKKCFPPCVALGNQDQNKEEEENKYPQTRHAHVHATCHMPIRGAKTPGTPLLGALYWDHAISDSVEFAQIRWELAMANWPFLDRLGPETRELNPLLITSAPLSRATAQQTQETVSWKVLMVSKLSVLGMNHHEPQSPALTPLHSLCLCVCLLRGGLQTQCFPIPCNLHIPKIALLHIDSDPLVYVPLNPKKEAAIPWSRPPGRAGSLAPSSARGKKKKKKHGLRVVRAQFLRG